MPNLNSNQIAKLLLPDGINDSYTCEVSKEGRRKFKKDYIYGSSKPYDIIINDKKEHVNDQENRLRKSAYDFPLHSKENYFFDEEKALVRDRQNSKELEFI